MQSKEVVIKLPRGQKEVELETFSFDPHEQARAELWNFFRSVIVAELQKYFDDGWGGTVTYNNIRLQETRREPFFKKIDEGDQGAKEAMITMYRVATFGFADIFSKRTFVEADEVRVTLYHK